MALRLTEAELARDTHTVLARVRDEGLEVIVEQDQRLVAVIRRPEGPGRRLSECIAIAKAYEENLGDAPVPDADFPADVQAASDAHLETAASRPEWMVAHCAAVLAVSTTCRGVEIKNLRWQDVDLFG